MKRIVILGNIGSGKTTIANLLSEKLSIPVYHLDLILFHEGKYINQREQIAKVKAIISQEKWIIDGNYSFTLPMRCEKADLIIFVNTNRWTCLWQYINRYISIKKVPDRKIEKFHGGCDILNSKVIKLVLGYEKNQKSRYKKIAKENANCKTVELSCRKKIIRLIETIE